VFVTATVFRVSAPVLDPASGPGSPEAGFHHCVSAVLKEGNRVLFVHRSPACSWAPETWDLPGGHVKYGELESDALAREAREELGIEAAAGALLPIGRLRGPDFDVAYFHVPSWAGTPYNAAPSEHTALAWMSEVELSQVTLADPDILPIVREVLRS
jgi:8-oxo-dGTP diphosphatase